MSLAILLIGSTLALDPKVEFEKFKAAHGKKYASLDEEQLRFHHFQENLKRIEKHNSEKHSWTLGVTKFADLSK